MRKARLDIEKVASGMILAEPVTNAGGVTLMPAGIRLTPMFILRLKKWNVVELDVFVEDRREERPASAELRRSSHTTASLNLSAEQEELAREIAMDVSRRFVNVKENPLMMQLRVSAIKRLVAHGQTGLLNRLRGIGAGGGDRDAET